MTSGIARVPAAVTPSSEVSGQEILFELAEAMSTLGKNSSAETLQRVYEVSPYHSEKLQQVLEHIPKATIRPVIECLIQICDPVSGLPSAESESLCKIARHLGVDPRSYREAVRTLEILGQQLRPGTQLDTAVGRALRTLDEHGVLGRKRLLEMARLLFGMAHRPRTAVLKDHTLYVADEAVSLLDLDDYDKSLQYHSPMWGARAAALTLYPETQAFGATTLEKVMTPLSRAITVDHPAQVLLPGRTVQRRWIRVDPIPSALKSANPIADMSHCVELRPAGEWEKPENRAELDVVYVGVRVAAAIVQPLWLNRLKVGIRLIDEKGNRACYVPERAEIWVWRGPLSAWSIVHEMAHAIDEVLVEGVGLASEESGNPIHAFVTMVRPHYRDVAEKRAKTVWQSLLKEGFGAKMRRRLIKGLVPLDEVVTALDWLSVEEKVQIKQLLDSSIDIELSDLKQALGPNRVLNGGELPLLEVLQESIVNIDDKASLVNIHLGWEPFRHAELRYLLSDRELFARFFDQYARLYLAQLGAPYGPAARPGDLLPNELAPLVPQFHEAMVEAQVLDLGHISRFKSKRLEQDTVLSLGIAATMAAVGAGLLQPS